MTTHTHTHTHRHTQTQIKERKKITSGLSLPPPSLPLSTQILLVKSPDPLTHLTASTSSALTEQLCRDTKPDQQGSVMDVARQESGVLMSFQQLVRGGLEKKKRDEK